MGNLRKDTIEQIDLAVNECMNDVYDNCYQNMSLEKYINECYEILQNNIKHSRQNGWNTEKDITSAIMLSGKENILKEIERQLKEWGIEQYL